ncbi:hypothetical protein CRE_24442 [Caenorhabditis remanei]|uniref:F-box domain-containing protein n=1 Tax=Caenorhabditis remanei TaxID=31234 RepID=E3MG20_CAERE|nr:hypothetical protein CRE_24442 [Caenorhabditis remanei]
MSSSFPLFNLPLEAILQVIQTMDPFAFIGFTLLSKRAQVLVNSLNLKTVGIKVEVTDSIFVCMLVGENILEWEFTKGNQSKPDKMKLNIFEERPKRGWTIVGSNFKQWMDYFKTTFNCSEFHWIEFREGSHVQDINEIGTSIGWIKELQISIDIDERDHVELILKHFPTKSLCLRGTSDIFLHPQQVLIQNFDSLELLSGPEKPVSLTIDEMLLLNSKEIKIGLIILTEKDINRFIKHWLRGSNPRMECLKIKVLSADEEEIFPIINKAVVFKGINHMEVPINQVRYFKSSSGETLPTKGGYDFYRNDGTKATIDIYGDEDSCLLTMYVWYPHCVGNSE